MASNYVKLVEGVYKVAGTRVAVDSIIHCYREGLSAESIAESYPALTLEQVYGAIAFYLANQPTNTSRLLKNSFRRPLADARGSVSLVKSTKRF